MITATVYSQGDSSLEKLKNSLVVKVHCEPVPPTMENKQVLFVVDVSGSMDDTMPSLKASLFAARNSLLSLLNIPVDNLSQEERDKIFTKTCNSSIITFSNKAKCIWESEKALGSPETTTFSEAVNKLKTEFSTNMGDGLRIAFQKANNTNATWIILLTDGCSNKGDYQTVSAFEQLVKKIPQNTKIVPLGYSTEFDHAVLSVLGTMSYLDSQESIAESFGIITGEIVSCYGINAKIILPKIQQETLGLDDLIPTTNKVSTNFIGSSSMGCVFSDRKYTYGYLPYGYDSTESIDSYLDKEGYLEWYDFTTGETVRKNFTIQKSEKFDDEILESYFDCLKAKTIMEVYQAKRNGDETGIRQIVREVEQWSHPMSIKHKQEVIRLCSQNDRSVNLSLLSQAGSSILQTSYRLGRFATPSQIFASDRSINDFHQC